MATIQHSAIPDAQLHEPKGVAGAAVNKVYLSDGAGSGAWTYPAGAAYGELYIAGGATTFTLAAASAYTRLDPGTAWDSGLSLNTTLTPDDGTITVGVAGVYALSFWCNFETTALAAGTDYKFKYAVNGSVGTRLITVQKNTAGTDELNLSAHGFVTLAANDVVSIYAAGDGTSSGANITMHEAGFMVMLVKAS